MAGYRRGLRLPDAVVVVTGASGGIGRATAVALAGAGARPVLVGRRAAELERVAAECGPDVLVAPADVRDVEALSAVARRAVDRFGRIDGWVAAAGAGVTGSLREVPVDEVRRVFEVDVLGALHGARAALPYMAERRHGVLVMLGSVGAQVAQPYDAPVGMAKAAVRSMAAALRQELRLDGVRGVAVTTVLVAPTDTPGRRAATSLLPVQRPERVAATILSQLRRPRLEKVAGGPPATALTHGHALVPGLTEWLVAQATRRR